MKKLRLERRTIAPLGVGSLRNAVGGVNDPGTADCDPAAQSQRDPRTIMIPCGRTAVCEPGPDGGGVEPVT